MRAADAAEAGAFWVLLLIALVLPPLGIFIFLLWLGANWPKD